MTQQEDWAIVVGIQSYPDLGDLGGPENDAQAFYDWVQSSAGGDVPRNHIDLILSSQYSPPFPSASSAEPTCRVVEQAFDKLQDLADSNSEGGEGLRVGRRLYIYLAGHGFVPNEEHTAILMANATKLRVGYHILGTAYANWFFHAGYFDEIVLFMDCCRERYPLAPLHLPPYMPINASDAVVKGKRFYGFGTKWSRFSRERLMDNGLIHGVFTTALLVGLKGAACNDEGQVTALSLSDFLYNSMKEFLKPEDLEDPEIPKEPDLVYDPHANRNFVFVSKRPHKTFLVTIHLPPSSVGKKVEILGGQRYKQVASIDTGPPIWEVPLSRGLYLVLILEDNAKKVVFEVSGTTEVVNVKFEPD